MKKITLLLLVLTTFSCTAPETGPSPDGTIYEEWGGTELTAVEDTVLNQYTKTVGTTIYGMPIEVAEFYKGKICVQKKSRNGVIYPSDIEKIVLEPATGAMMTITLNADLPYDKVVVEELDGTCTIKMFDIITEYGYNDWGSTIGTISFKGIGNDSYDLII